MQTEELKAALALLPKDENELIEASAPQRETPERRRLFRARLELERLWVGNGDERLYEIFTNLPHDVPHFEQLIISGEGQQAVRANVIEAREALKSLVEGK